MHPIVAIIAVNAGFIVWHLTPAYDAALSSWWLYDLMQATLLLVSLLFWWPIVTPCSPPARALTGFGKLGYIVLATIPQTLGGLLVALAGHVLYPGYGSGPQLVGVDALTDQQIAGASIALVSKIALFAAFWVVFMNLLSTGSDGREDDGRRWWGRIEPPAGCAAAAPLRASPMAGRRRRRQDDRRADAEAGRGQGAGRVRVSPGLIAALSRWFAASMAEIDCSMLALG